MGKLFFIFTLFAASTSVAEDRVTCKLDQYDLIKKEVTEHLIIAPEETPKKIQWTHNGLVVEVELFGKDTIHAEMSFKQAKGSSIADINAKLPPRFASTTTSLYYGDRDAFNLYCRRTEAAQ